MADDCGVPLEERLVLKWSGRPGDVYVVDTGNDRVEEFTTKGLFVLMLVA